MHSNVHISKYAQIGDFVWIFPYVVHNNDPHPPSNTKKSVIIKNFVSISTMSVILPGVILEKDTLIGAKSLVSKNTSEGSLLAGNPAKKICMASKIKLKDDSKKSAYSWRRHFHRSYPFDIVNDWKKEFSI